MSEKSFRFARNMGFNALGQVSLAAINFFTVPYLIRHMGVETYGLYIIMHAAASYLMLSSFGAGAAVIKHSAAAYGARDRRSLDDTIRYGTWICGAGALVGGIILWVLARSVAVRVFHVPDHLAFSAVFVLRCVAVAGVFVALIQAATAVMQGLQRFDVQSATTLLQSGAMPVGAVVLVAAGFGLPAIAGWYSLLNVVVCLAAGLMVWKLLRPTRPYHWGRRLRRRDFLLWALTSWSGGLAWMVAYQFDKLFIARDLSLAALTLYAVPAGLLQRLQIVSSTVATVTVPMMSELQGPEALENVRRMYFKSSRFILWICLPILVALFSFMPQFLSLWLGGQFSDASCWPARLLVLTQVLFLLNAGPHTVTFSRDHPWYMPAWAWSQALLSLLAWRLLIPRYGLMGVASGSLIAMALPTAVNLWLVNRHVVGVRLRHYAAEVLYAPFLSAGLMLALLFPVHAWATGWFRLVGLVVIGGALYYGTTWILLNEEDRALLKRFLHWEGRG
jgi:O-antigen/teichoic acid export membrane protein